MKFIPVTSESLNHSFKDTKPGDVFRDVEGGDKNLYMKTDEDQGVRLTSLGDGVPGEIIPEGLFDKEVVIVSVELHEVKK